MLKNYIKLTTAVLVAAAFSNSGPSLAKLSAGQAPGVTRRILTQQDLPIPGYVADLVATEIPVGAREGRHTHPGTLVAYVEEGTLTLESEGKAPATYKAGDTFSVEPGKVHEGINNGNALVKVIVAFVVEKGKPLTSPAQ